MITPLYQESNDCEYIQQALDFCNRVGLTIEFKFSSFTTPPWGDTRVDKYYVTLTRQTFEDGEWYKGKDETFSFYNSIADSGKGNTPSPYDILACLSITFEENFQDFCESFGYEQWADEGYEHRGSLETFEKCMKQNDKLNYLFNEEELELLHEIV